MTYDATPPASAGSEPVPDATSPSGSDEFHITDLPGMVNIAEILDKKTLTDIATKVWDEYKIDAKSREEKVKEWDAAADAFKMSRKAKTYPFANAANVKFPLLLTSAIQFSHRAMAAMVHDGKVAKAKVIGEDPGSAKVQKADRVATWQNYQMLDRDPSWVEEKDRLLLQLPVFGDAFAKLYRDPTRGNVSELVSCYDYIVNAGCRAGEDAPRATQRYDLYPHQIVERKRDGRFLDIDLPYSRVEEESEDKSKGKPEESYTEDPAAPHEFLEQYRREDLDDDGYPEPYTVTLHVGTKEVVRMVAAYDKEDIIRKTSGYNPMTGQEIKNGAIVKITKRPEPTFVQYGFLPDPDGGFYNIGYGRLLADTVDTVNTTINQILDAGNLQNASGGFIGKEFRLKSGTYTQDPGVFKQVAFSGDDIRKSIVRMEHPGPSPVLFQMLTFLTEMADKIASSPEVLGGEAPPNQPATTTLAMIEQGLSVFKGIMGRMLRSLGQELKASYRLQARHVQEDQEKYARVIDIPQPSQQLEGQPGMPPGMPPGPPVQADMSADFNAEDCDVVPVADASIVTDAQKMAKAQMIMQVLMSPLGKEMNVQEGLTRYFKAADIVPEGLVNPPNQQAQQMQMQQMQLQMEELMAKIEKLRADAEKSLADARVQGTTIQTDQMKAELEALVIGQQAQQDMQQQDAQHGMDMQQQAVKHYQSLGIQQDAHQQQLQQKAADAAQNLQIKKAQADAAIAAAKAKPNGSRTAA